MLAERYAESNPAALKKDMVEAVEEVLRKPRAESHAFVRKRRSYPRLYEMVQEWLENTRRKKTMREVRKLVELSLELLPIYFKS